MRRSEDPPQFLTSAKAAALLGVSPSTIKRWVDDGTLRSERTAGGHRRIARQVIEAFRRSAPRADEVRPPGGLGLLDLLLSSASSRELEAHLIAQRAGAASVGVFADSIGETLQEMGTRWARGELAIADEHIASERLARALARLAEWTPTRVGAPIALLAAAAADEHTLGLSLAELCLREVGWDTRWVGRRTPTLALVELIERQRPRVRLVALSASVVSSDSATLAHDAALVAAACRSVSAVLVLGGDGAWPEHPRSARRVRSLVELEQVARKSLGSEPG